jgi:hypothetical protein
MLFKRKSATCIGLMSHLDVNVDDHTLIRNLLALLFLLLCIIFLLNVFILSSLYRYVFWDQHEPVEGVYNFEDNNDLTAFIQLAQKIGFVVILRVGP